MAIKRRKFLGIGLSSFAGFSLPKLFQSRARAAEKLSTAVEQLKETGYWERTDRFDEKLKQLELAWRRKDYRLSRALTNSLRSTAIQAQAEEEPPGVSLISTARYQEVQAFPASWKKWALGWKYVKVLTLEE